MIQPLISSAETSAEAWEQLSSSYANSSRSKIIYLKAKLAKSPKENKSVANFLNEMRSIADELALTHSNVSEEDLVVHIIAQLGDEFNPIVAAIKSSEGYNSNYHRSRGGYNGNTYHPTQSHNGNRSYPVDSFCQFCETACHHICDCMNFAKFLKDNNICVVNSSSLNAQPSPTANVTTMTSSMKQLWLFDTGASHHATYNLSSLQTYADYEGPDEILLGDGNSLSISHTGHTHINTPHRPLSLSNVLCVPRLRHNLISIAKLCKSNPASVKFFSSYFLVKYLRTWATLLRVENIDDVYWARFSSLP
ncbi:retrovirus-related pol polyprotein from transposon TNT 1-94 [Tanacetum coccineum]